jgi:Haem-dependent oxidative N-demethylase, alpha subunit-like
MTGLPRAFSIGLAPLADRARWLAPDALLAAQLAEKERLIASVPETVFMVQPEMEDAQREVAELLARHLPEAFPETYRTCGDAVEITGTGKRIALPVSGPRLLENVARLVRDDLVIMSKREDGWTLVAASLCFPTFWSLAEKFGRPITAIHAPVPGFGDGTRNAVLIERIFDNLKPGEPVQRSNWSIHNDCELYHAGPHGKPIRCDDLTQMARLFLRREHQTLTRLPESGDLLFTIRVNADPLQDLETAPEQCAALAERLMEIDAEGLRYKGLFASRDRLAEHLTSVAAGL